MDELETFRAVTVPRLQQADLALHDGDPRPRIAMWSQRDPVTLFGAWRSGTGWAEIHPILEGLGRDFSDCESFEQEIVATGQSGDLGYVVAFEHTTASVGGVPRSYTLRVTTVLRREDGEWKVVHRHADMVTDDSAP